VKESNFPWMISNCLDINTKQPLADAKLKHILQVDNLKIGLIGLVEQEWIETLSTIGYDDLIYQSFVDTGKRLANELKANDVNLIFYYF
jgi:5'-nucleotidase